MKALTAEFDEPAPFQSNTHKMPVRGAYGVLLALENPRRN
jgi:hypothetical protein